MKDYQIVHTSPKDILVVDSSRAFSFRRELTFVEEAKRNPEAVFNRLCNQGRYEDAEEVLDLYV